MGPWIESWGTPQDISTSSLLMLFAEKHFTFLVLQGLIYYGFGTIVGLKARKKISLLR